MSAFEDREAALAANERVVSWVEETLSDLVPTPPKITFGEVLFPELVAKPSNAKSPYVDIVTYDGITQPPESVAPKAREHLIPILKRAVRIVGNVSLQNRDQSQPLSYRRRLRKKERLRMKPTSDQRS